jgi:hypothetical protein
MCEEIWALNLMQSLSNSSFFGRRDQDLLERVIRQFPLVVSRVFDYGFGAEVVHSGHFRVVTRSFQA